MIIVLTFDAFRAIFKTKAELVYRPLTSEIDAAPLDSDGNSSSFYSIQPAPTEADFVAAYPNAVKVDGLQAT